MAAANPMNPQSWNRYAYVNNNPLTSNDPSGLCSQDENGWYSDDCFDWGSGIPGADQGAYGSANANNWELTGGMPPWVDPSVAAAYKASQPTVAFVYAEEKSNAAVSSGILAFWMPPVGISSAGPYATLPGTNYCGPNNRGWGSPALNKVDAACEAHDEMYLAADINWWTPSVFLSAAQKTEKAAADAQLCSSVEKVVADEEASGQPPDTNSVAVAGWFHCGGVR
jgi:Phospholipase A2-like domain